MIYDIEAKNLTLKYGNFEALRNITFSLESGKICGLLGRNGAGKTSLLTLLASLREPTSGSLQIAGEIPFENPRIMENVAFIYNRDYQEEGEKVKGLLEAAQSYRPGYDPEYADYLVERFKLPLDKPVNKLSTGKKSALNVIIGLAGRVPITIFDEVYLGMDAPTREIFYQELLADHQNHPRTIILSTHLVSEMERLFEEVIIIDRGKMVLQGAYESLVAKGASVIGSAEAVDEFVKDMKRLKEERLGQTKAVTVFGVISDEEKRKALQQGLEIGSLTLQDLFIHLTEEE